MAPSARLRVAAYGHGAAAVQAWKEWASTRDLRVVDPVEQRLLPAVYRNLRDAGVADDAIAPIVKQAARSLWIRTRLLLRQAAETVRVLDESGIESMLLKGAALVMSGACDAQVRPMSDFDLLVHPRDARRAATLLAEHGWIVDAPVDERNLALRHAALLKRGEASCDLHWWALWESRDEEADALFWSGAEPVTFDGVTVRVPRPEHQLLHVIVHGTRAFDNINTRWIGDALAVLRTRTLDWPRLIADVRQRDFAFPVGEALAYLVETFAANVPVEVIEALRDQRVSRARRRLYVIDPDARRVDPVIAFVSSLLAVARRQRPLWLLGNLQQTVGVDRAAQLPLAIAKRIPRLLRRLFGSR